MTFEFNNRVINNKEITKYTFYPGADINFIGYLNPNGDVVDYRYPLGNGGHAGNPITNIFVRYFYNTSESNKKILEEKIEIYREDYLYNIKKYGYYNTKDQLKYDLYRFLYICNSNDIEKLLQRSVSLLSYTDFWLEHFLPPKRFQNEGNDEYYERECKERRRAYVDYKDSIILADFKDVLVQYLDYSSIERLPRTITTSKLNIYETFYDYILNDFKIYQIPKKVYDERLGMYVDRVVPEYMISDRELRLKNELDSICKTIPLEKRKKYYRYNKKIY